MASELTVATDNNTTKIFTWKNEENVSYHSFICSLKKICACNCASLTQKSAATQSCG